MREKHKKSFYKIVFFVGLMVMIWQIIIYRNTIIELKILLRIIFAVGISTMFFALKDFQKLFKYSRTGTLYFFAFIQSTVSWGFLVCSIFMLSNYYLASDESIKTTFQIVERSSMSGRKYHREERTPTFKIMYKGRLKELVFGKNYYDQMETYQYVELVVKKGFWGYDVIVEKRLKL